MGKHPQELSFAERYDEIYEECEQKDHACDQQAMWQCLRCRARLCENCARFVHPDTCRGPAPPPPQHRKG